MEDALEIKQEPQDVEFGLIESGCMHNNKEEPYDTYYYPTLSRCAEEEIINRFKDESYTNGQNTAINYVADMSGGNEAVMDIHQLKDYGNFGGHLETKLMGPNIIIKHDAKLFGGIGSLSNMHQQENIEKMVHLDTDYIVGQNKAITHGTVKPEGIETILDMHQHQKEQSDHNGHSDINEMIEHNTFIKCYTVDPTLTQKQEKEDTGNIRHSDGTSYNCGICSKEFSEREKLLFHLNTHPDALGKKIGGKKNRNGTCYKQLKSDTSLGEKQKEVCMGEKRHTCYICNKEDLTASQLKRHKLKHKCLKQSKGEMCNTKYRSDAAQICTISKTTNPNENPWHKMEPETLNLHKCDFCGEQFNKFFTLYSHMRIHLGYHPNICHFCSRWFQKNNHLSRHELTHTCYKPYQCKMCYAKFARSEHLKKHQAPNDPRKHSLSCKKCGVTFVSLGCLRHHKLVHKSTDLAKRKLKHDYCLEKKGKRFVSLLKPARILRKQRPYNPVHEGPLIPFDDKGPRLVIQLESQNFKCSICDTRFSNFDSFRIHRDHDYECTRRSNGEVFSVVLGLQNKVKLELFKRIMNPILTQEV